MLSSSFIFTLQEFARELVSLVDAMGRIYAAERANAARGWWFQRIPKALFDRIRALWVKPAPTFRQNGHQQSKARNTEQMSIQRRLCTYHTYAHISNILTLSLFPTGSIICLI